MRVAIALLVCALSAPAWADSEVYSASGSADGVSEEARIRALDRAFVAALKKSILEVVSRDVIKANRDAIRTRLLNRARKYIVTYETINTGASRGRTRVQLEVTVDTSAVRAVLTELGLVRTAPDRRPDAVILLRVAGPGVGSVSFGPQRKESAAEVAVREGLRSLGFATVAARTPVPLTPDAGVPVADGRAGAIAKAAKAGVAVVLHVEVAAKKRIRGTRQVGAASVVTVRVVGADGRVLAASKAKGAAFGSSPVVAARRAAKDGAERALNAVAVPLVAAFPVNDKRPKVEVLVRGHGSWAPVSRLVRKLSAESGISQVDTRVGRGRDVTLLLGTSLPRGRVADMLRNVQIVHAELSVIDERDVLEVVISEREQAP